MTHAIQKHYGADDTFNTLFLPGLPRPYMERPLITDLVSLGSNIYTVTYPGTYGAPGEVFPDSLTQVIQGAITELNKTGLPLLVIAYSLSTVFAPGAMKAVENPLGFIFFSPIIDLKHNSVDDVHKINARLNELDDINVNDAKFTFAETWESAVEAYYKKLDALAKLKVPLVFIRGEKDPAIKSDMVVDALEQYRKTRAHNKVSIISLPTVGHSLDEQYEASEVKRLLRRVINK